MPNPPLASSQATTVTATIRLDMLPKLIPGDRSSPSAGTAVPWPLIATAPAIVICPGAGQAAIPRS
ncbi:hypothetical protein ACF3NT_08950 [Naumannella halotolerans]|uniref:hypothetical protein n=1 Tax=Naumannella halotolerans TaxID=993414 RepID=UPI00370DA5D2